MTLQDAIKARVEELRYHPTAAGVTVHEALGLILYDNEGETVAEFVTVDGLPDRLSRLTEAKTYLRELEAEPINDEGDRQEIRMVNVPMKRDNTGQYHSHSFGVRPAVKPVPPPKTAEQLAQELRQLLTPEEIARLKELL